MIFLKACLLTVLIEGIWFWLLGYRSCYRLWVIVLVNVITNLSLNYLNFFVFRSYAMRIILLLEAIVVAWEYFMYRAAFGREKGLFLKTLGANVLSYGTGLLLQAAGLL